MSGRVAYLALTLALAMGVLPARAANFFEKNFWLSGPRYDRVIPACDYQPALDRIIDRFGTKERRFWNSDLRIVGFDHIRETALLPWAAQSIPRRFCRASVRISDGLRHPIYYALGEDTGMIGMSFGVDFCVVGLDRNWAYNPACRAARP